MNKSLIDFLMLCNRDLIDSGILEIYKLDFFLNKQYRNLEKNNEFFQFETNIPAKYISFLIHKIPTKEDDIFENGVGRIRSTLSYSEKGVYFFESHVLNNLFAEGHEVKNKINETPYTFIKLRRELLKNNSDFFPKTILKRTLKDLGLERIASEKSFVKIQDKYNFLLR